MGRYWRSLHVTESISSRLMPTPYLCPVLDEDISRFLAVIDWLE